MATRNKKKQAKTRVRASKVTLWQMMRDVLVASMNRGQFPLALVGMIFLVMILRMPQE